MMRRYWVSTLALGLTLSGCLGWRPDVPGVDRAFLSMPKVTEKAKETTAPPFAQFAKAPWLGKQDDSLDAGTETADASSTSVDLPEALRHSHLRPVRPLRRALVFPGRTEELERVRAFVREAMAAGGVEARQRNGISLAVDEAVSNVVRHAYEAGRPGRVEVHIEIDARRCLVRILDSGRSFHPPAGTGEVDLEEHVRQGKRSGLGIFLMRQVMDEVEYTFREGKQNELLLVKHL